MLVIYAVSRTMARIAASRLRAVYPRDRLWEPVNAEFPRPSAEDDVGHPAETR